MILMLLSRLFRATRGGQLFLNEQFPTFAGVSFLRKNVIRSDELAESTMVVVQTKIHVNIEDALCGVLSIVVGIFRWARRSPACWTGAQCPQLR